jgi:hypothetical protein
MRTLLFVSTLSLLMTACAPVQVARTPMPVPLTVADDANPDVIWVIREVQVENRDRYNNTSQVTKYGLFACYRKPIDYPGPPECFLAKTTWSLDDLAWPGAIFLKEGAAPKN